MKATIGFGFFLLFLAGFALVYLLNVQRSANSIPTADELAASAWRPTHIGDLRVDNDSDIYVQFETDGRLTGFAGCNSFSSRYRLDGNKIDVDPIGVTRKSCAPDIMSVESSLVQALQLATTVAGVEKRMAMRNELEEPTARFVAIDRRPVEE